MACLHQSGPCLRIGMEIHHEQRKCGNHRLRSGSRRFASPVWICGSTGGGVPQWTVETDSTAPSKPQVLRQSGIVPFPWCVLKDSSLIDGTLEVRFRPSFRPHPQGVNFQRAATVGYLRGYCVYVQIEPSHVLLAPRVTDSLVTAPVLTRWADNTFIRRIGIPNGECG